MKKEPSPNPRGTTRGDQPSVLEADFRDQNLDVIPPNLFVIMPVCCSFLFLFLSVNDCFYYF